MAAGELQGEAVSWADVAITLPQREPEASIPIAHGELGKSLAILDASAIIGAADLGKYAESLVTTSEVYAECRDKQSLQVLAALPFGITVQEPTDTSVAAGKCNIWRIVQSNDHRSSFWAVIQQASGGNIFVGCSYEVCESHW